LESSIFRKLKNFINPDIKYIDEDSECWLG
jgi:hypothetical protein